MKDFDLLSYNRNAWNQEVKRGNQWTLPVADELIGKARNGDPEIVLTPKKPVPKSWFPRLEGLQVLCLACGGGQQGPILAAAGARVTVFDNSDGQLQRDRSVSEAHNLGITAVQGDMRDLSCFSDCSFDLIFHPVSNQFVDDPLPVWKEAYRVLRQGGILLAGFCNPLLFMFPEDASLQAVHPLPYSDLKNLSEAELAGLFASGEPIEFGHTLTQQIGGQLASGFVITDMYEDNGVETAVETLSDTFIATRALKP
jgi:SAM-dependent methyltransferase